MHTPFKLLFLSVLVSLLSGCQSTESTSSGEPIVAQPTASSVTQKGATVWRPAKPVEPVAAVESVANVTEPNRVAEVTPAAEKVSEAPVAKVPVVEVESPPTPKPEAEVARVAHGLSGGALGTLNEADELLKLSNEQYNALVAVLEARTAEWKALLADKKSMDSVSFEAGKSRIFGGYSKRMLAVFTKEQAKLWRSR